MKFYKQNTQNKEVDLTNCKVQQFAETFFNLQSCEQRRVSCHPGAATSSVLDGSHYACVTSSACLDRGQQLVPGCSVFWHLVPLFQVDAALGSADVRRPAMCDALEKRWQGLTY